MGTDHIRQSGGFLSRKTGDTPFMLIRDLDSTTIMLHRLHNSLIQAGRLVFLDLVYLATTDAM
jgi:hypothetical protein